MSPLRFVVNQQTLGLFESAVGLGLRLVPQGIQHGVGRHIHDLPLCLRKVSAHGERPVFGYHALGLAIASQLAYAPELELRNHLRLVPHDRLDVFRAEATGTEAFVLTLPDVVVLAFRGTDPFNAANYATDIDVVQECLPIGRVHRGFFRALESVWTDLRRHVLAQMTATRTLLLTGHSLGGALASLAAIRLLSDPEAAGAGLVDHESVRLHTFGEPKVGDARYARTLDELLPGRAFRHVHNHDAIPRLPVFGYTHGGVQMYYDTHLNRVCRPKVWQQVVGSFLGPEDIQVRLSEGWTGFLPGALRDHFPHHYVRAALHNREAPPPS